MNKLTDAYGVGLCALIAGMALFLSSLLPIGAIALAIILGAIVGNSTKLHKLFTPGISFSEKQILSLAIALMGVRLNFQILKGLGFKTVLLVISALTFTILVSLLLSRILKFNTKFALLLGIGNGVCGSSAIAATEQIIGADEESVGLSVAIVNFLGTIGIFLVPFIAKRILHLSDIHSGILAGNTLQAVGQVVAAGFSISDNAGQIATLIKMTRILMLFPLVFILLYLFSGRSQPRGPKTKKPVVPLFIIGFVFFSLLPTFNLLSEEMIKIISQMSHYSLIVAMAGIGLKITLQSILKDGRSALLMGSLIFLFQLCFSGIMILLLY